MTKFCDEVHRAGAVAVVQLTHLSAVWAPSPVPVVGAQDYTPHVLGEEEIEFCLNSYADAAAARRMLGADGIEIHCAHETLGYSFLSPVTNRRTDRWGGGPQERIRFVVEALRARPRAHRQLARAGHSHQRQGVSRRAATTISKCARCSTDIGETGLLDFVGHRRRSLLGRAVLRAVVVLRPCASFASTAKRHASTSDRKIAVLFTRPHQRPRRGGGSDQGRLLRPGGHGARGHRRSRVRQQGARGPVGRDPPLHQLHALHRRGVGTQDLSVHADLLHQSGHRQRAALGAAVPAGGEAETRRGRRRRSCRLRSRAGGGHARPPGDAARAGQALGRPAAHRRATPPGATISKTRCISRKTRWSVSASTCGSQTSADRRRDQGAVAGRGGHRDRLDPARARRAFPASTCRTSCRAGT